MKPNETGLKMAQTNTETPSINGGGASSVEGNKARLESQASEFAAEVATISNLPGIKAIQSIFALVGKKNKDSVNNPMKINLPITGFMKDAASGDDAKFAKTLKSGVDTQDENDIPSANIIDMMDSLSGTYKWNFSSEKFDFSPAPGDNEIVVLFPATENSTTNNAEFKIHTVSFGQTQSSNALFESSSQLISCEAYLSVDDETAMTYTYRASYHSNGYPASISWKLSISDYSLNYEFMFNSGKFASDYSFKKNTTTLFAEGLSIEGNLSEEKAKDLVLYYSDSTNEDMKAAKIGEFISTAMMYYQFMDVKIIGSIDAAGMSSFIDLHLDEFTAEDTDEDTDLQNANTAISGINKYCDLYAVFASSSSTIADTELYIYTKENDEGKETNEVSMRLLFPDGSSADLASYLADPDNFSTFTEQLDNYKSQVQAK